MQTTREDSPLAAEIVAKVLGLEFAGDFRGIVIENDGAVAGAVIFNGYERGRNIWVTWGSDGPLSRRTFRDLGDYVFRVLECRRCSAVTRESNAKARRALEIIGFRQEGVMRDHFGDEDGILYGLTRREQTLVKVEL